MEEYSKEEVMHLTEVVEESNKSLYRAVGFSVILGLLVTGDPWCLLGLLAFCFRQNFGEGVL